MQGFGRRNESWRTPEEREAERKRREAQDRERKVGQILDNLKGKKAKYSTDDYDIEHYGDVDDYTLAKVVWKGRIKPEWASTTHKGIVPVTFLVFHSKKENAKKLAGKEPANKLQEFFPGTLHVLHANIVAGAKPLPMKLFLRFHDNNAYGVAGEIAQVALLNRIFERAAAGNIEIHAEPKESELGISKQYIEKFEEAAKQNSFRVTQEGPKRVAAHEVGQPGEGAAKQDRQVDRNLLWSGTNVLRHSIDIGEYGERLLRLEEVTGNCRPPRVDESNLEKTFRQAVALNVARVYLETKSQEVLGNFKQIAGGHKARIEETEKGAIAHLP